MDLTELESQARDKLGQGVYDYIAGGSDDEVTLDDNVAAWGRIRLRPRILRDVATVDTSTTLLGTALGAPLAIAPSAFHQLLDPEGEAATARGAAAAEALMVLSSRCSIPPAQVAAAAPGSPRWFQVYVWGDRQVTADLVTEAAESGYSALVLTADTPVLGNRRRDERNAFKPGRAVMAGRLDGPGRANALESYLSPKQDPSVTFDDIGWLHELTGLPVVVKGVLRGDDAVRSVEAGAAAVMVSNHGGRQLDGAVATADALREVVDAVGDRTEVYVDGGIRSGTAMVKALAMGARACMVARPVAWGLAVGGADGVTSVLSSLRADLVLAMRLAGAANLAECSPDLLAG
jgi:4-hydroxymandelate oxidase